MDPHNHNIVIEALAQAIQKQTYAVCADQGITNNAVAPALSRACVDQWLGRFLPTPADQEAVLPAARLMLSTMFAQALGEFEMLMVQGTPITDIWQSIRSVEGAQEEWEEAKARVTEFAQKRYLAAVDPSGKA